MTKARVLLVDDDPLFHLLVEEYLEHGGYSMCSGIGSGEEIEAAVEASDPDLVLMDIGLSGEMDGIEAAARVTAFRDIPVVYLAANVDRTVVERIKATAPYGFVYKPVMGDQLLPTLGTALQRHRLDRRVRESRNWLFTVLGSIDDAVISIDTQTRVTYTNRAATNLVGHACLGEKLTNVLPLANAADGSRVAAHLERRLSIGGKAEMEGPLEMAADSVGMIKVQLAVYPLGHGANQHSMAVVILRNVTNEQRLIDELRSFKLAVDSTQIGVTITDLDRRICYVNPAEAEMHGYTAEELIGQPASIFGTSKEAPGLASPVPEGLNRWKRSTINVRKNGSRFPAELFSDVVRNEQGAPVALVTCNEDMSDRLQADEQVRKLYRAVDQSPNLVVITDVDGRIEYVNPEFTRVTGYSAEEATGQNPSVLKSGRMDPSVYESLWRTITEGGTWRGEFLNRRKDGSQYWAIASISGIRDDRGEVRHYVGVQQDITERKQLENELRQKNEDLERLNRLKSELVAVTSHDLKSPLHAMISLASLIKDLDDRLDPASLARYVDKIIASGHRLSSFISEILDAEKMDSGLLDLDIQPVQVEEILEECVELAGIGGKEKDLRVVFSRTDEPTEIQGDATRLRQIFNNLLGNAIKFSPTGSEIRVGICESAEMIEVSVNDQGPGIPEEDLEKVFDRYYQVAKDGAATERGFGVGLGLYITRNLVRLHGGSIHAENLVAEGGCRFIVKLPITAVGDRAVGLCALIVDQDGGFGPWLEETLQRKDVATTVVNSALEAERVARAKRPHMVFAARVSESPELLAAYSTITRESPSTRLVTVEGREIEHQSAPAATVLVAPVPDSEIFELLRELEIEGRQETMT